MKFEENYCIEPADIPNKGKLFVDHQQNGRSGHLGHALVECASGKILDFYPNCSTEDRGHSANGWMEYKASYDHGETWSQPFVFKPSKGLLDATGNLSAMCEKAVALGDGTVIVYQLICDLSDNVSWQPYMVPTYSKSTDEGETWSGLTPLGNRRGRIYDAKYSDSTIYVLLFANDAVLDWTGQDPSHFYSLLVSTDGGKSYSERSRVPIPVINHGYGNLLFTRDHKLIAYNYDLKDEYHLSYSVSNDNGRTWSENGRTFLAKRIRNPQAAAFGDGYLLHGRSGNEGDSWGNFVLYYSEDGIVWDEGRYLCMREAGYGAYSNNLVIGKGTEYEKLLIQASFAYYESQTNILHWNIRRKTK